MYHKGTEVSPLRRQSIRSYANALRSTLQLNTSYFPIVEVIEFALPKIISNFVLLILPEKEMGSKHGITYPDQNTIHLREDVYDGACNGQGRDRFTIAHELGHLLIHKNVPLSRTNCPETIPAFKNSEWQADCFAGELLVLSTRLEGRNYKTVQEVASEFGVSNEAAKKQCKANGLIVSWAGEIL
jgi:uncharacterized protein DUF955